MWELAKKLDPTRLVEDMSVCHWEHLEYYLHCDTDINSWHFYINDYGKAKAHIDKVVTSTFVGSSFNYVPGFQRLLQENGGDVEKFHVAAERLAREPKDIRHRKLQD